MRWLLLCLSLLSGWPAAADTLRIAVIGDMNGSYGSTTYSDTVHAAIAHIIADRPDLVISVGDMIAGQGTNPHQTEAEVLAMWAGFDAAVTDPLAAAGIPFLVTPGNHDGSGYSAFADQRALFQTIWQDRKPDLKFVDSSSFPMRYAVSHEGVLIIGLESTLTGPLPQADMVWLQDLLQREGKAHRATILFAHLPLVAYTKGRERDIIGDPALLDLLSENGVDLYLSGHHHAYYSGRAKGVLFVGLACLGAGPRTLLGTSKPAARGYTMVEVDDAGHIIEFTLAPPDFAQKIPLSSLPRSMGAGGMNLTRSDLDGP